MSKEFLDIQATIEYGFTLKRVRDMTRTYSQLSTLEVFAKIMAKSHQLFLQKSFILNIWQGFQSTPQNISELSLLTQKYNKFEQFEQSSQIKEIS